MRQRYASVWTTIQRFHGTVLVRCRYRGRTQHRTSHATLHYVVMEWYCNVSHSVTLWSSKIHMFLPNTIFYTFCCSISANIFDKKRMSRKLMITRKTLLLIDSMKNRIYSMTSVNYQSYSYPILINSFLLRLEWLGEYVEILLDFIVNI